MPARLDPPADSFPIWVSEHTLIPGLYHLRHVPISAYHQ